MSFFLVLKRRLKSLILEKNPVAAYNLLAGNYDSQKDNLLMKLDESLLQKLVKPEAVKNKIILDLGCGTGRHWKFLLDSEPKKLIGADSSEKMLAVLRSKYPGAETHVIVNDALKVVASNSVDLIISTLTIGYIENLENCLEEWNRWLTNGGEVIITDYHPEMLSKGGGRTFVHRNKTIAVRNFIHPLSKIRDLVARLNWKEQIFLEIKIDETLKPYYAAQNAMGAYEKFKGTALIYGIHLKKA